MIRSDYIAKLFGTFIWIVLAIVSSEAFAQCVVYASSDQTEVICGECVTLSHAGYGSGNVSFSEDFNNGQPSGWSFTQQASFNNPCSANGVDGTTHLWMGDQSGVPRSLETLPLDFSAAVAPAGGTICFDMLFSEQGDASPCEGPDEPDEGVYLQYSTDGGTNWITIEYFDPNGGNDPQLVNWNNWCFQIPQGALTNNVQFRWFQDADSGAEYDHWGIDNVEIIVNDPNIQFIWQHDNYTTALPGDNPTQVCPNSTTSYTVELIPASGPSCQASIEVVVNNPDVIVNAGLDQTICVGDCIDLQGEASVIESPASTPTYSNTQTQILDPNVGLSGGVGVNVNVQGLNMTTVEPNSILEVCVDGLTFFGTELGGGFPPTISNVGIEALTLELICPDGGSIILVPSNTIAAGQTGDSYQNACFVPAGGSSIVGATAPITGSFSPSQPLSGLDGCTSNGVWTVLISSGAGFGFGSFEGWSITFDDPEISYEPNVLWSPTTNMAPGEETTLTPQVCPIGAITYTLTASDNAGCVTVSDDISITIDQNCCDPQTPPIQGPTPLCQNEAGAVYSVTNTPGSTYTWTVPAGATIVSGQGTNSITVDWGTTGGQVSVVETIQCGDGPAITFDVVLDPSQTLVINDPAAVCQPNTVDITAAAITAGSTGGGALSYWTDAAGTQPLANPNAVATSGTYYIQAGTGSCADIQPVTVTIDNCAGCVINSVDVQISDCYTSGQGFLQYDVDVTVTFSDPPATGQLVVSDCYFNTQTIDPPFVSPTTVSFAGLPQDGQDCDFGAVFTDDQNCNGITTYTAPPTITYFTSNCVIGTGEVDGTIEFNNPPATGTIVVEIFDGTSTQSTNIQPPFNSPEAWLVTGLDPAAANYVITYYFSDFPGCEQTQTIICGCAAEGGTTTTTMTGDGTNEFILCEGDQLDIVNNGDYSFPDDDGPLGGFAYQPAYTFLVYNCPPTAGLFPPDDACFVGIVPSDGSMTDINDGNSIFSVFPPGTFTNNEVYYVPITLYHYDPITPNYIVNASCWDLGTTSTVTYLPPIVTNVTPDCQTNTVSVDISGGYPAVYGGDFTASNLLPATASFVNATTQNNGTIVIDGLQDGDMYSFDITDENGCPVTITGGPFVALPVAAAGADAQTCILSYQLEAVASYGTGTWTGGPAGTTFAPSANDPNATVTVTTAGTYTFTWTEDNGNGCVASDDVDITFSLMSIPAVVTDASCGLADGEIVVAPQGGVPPYTYSWTSGGATAVESNLGPGSTTVTVTDGTGCSLDSTFVISQPITFNYVLDVQDETCFGACDGIVDIQPDGPGPYGYAWTPNVGNSGYENTICQGDYEILVADQDGCTQVINVTIGGPTEIDVQVDSDVNVVCIDGTANLSSVVSGGTPPYGTYLWTSSPVDPLLVANDPNPVVTPAVQTTYTLVVTDANGCPSSPVDVTIDVLPPLTLDFIRPIFSPDTGICPYDFATIDLTAGGGDGNYTIYLLPDNVNPVALPIDTQPLVTTTFDFMVTDGCTTPPAFASSTVTVFELPEIQIAALPDSGCQPLTVDFADLTQPQPVGWSWNFGDPGSNSNTSSSATPTHVYEDAGSYDVSLTVTTAQGCVTDTTLTDFVDVFPLPTAIFELNPEVVNLLNANIDFTDQSLGNIEDWDWNFGDGETSSIQDPSHLYTDTGNFTISLVVTTDKGCIDQTARQLIVEPDFMFYVPNAFTPNQDGRNDGFRGYGEGINWDTYQMSIFDRWGELIYYTEDIDDPWDGTYKGAQVEVAVYVWKIRFYDVKGNDHDYYGHVTLVR
ncbi:MAG: gliding motility-associated C-terminal domain-containing protein [Flavobacteriales bacterium]|nr:gliding motility-associated C-terminal domain-containing protein [Flavobacteriales bacterium]